MECFRSNDLDHEFEKLIWVDINFFWTFFYSITWHWFFSSNWTLWFFFSYQVGELTGLSRAFLWSHFFFIKKNLNIFSIMSFKIWFSLKLIFTVFPILAFLGYSISMIRVMGLVILPSFDLFFQVFYVCFVFLFSSSIVLHLLCWKIDFVICFYLFYIRILYFYYLGFMFVILDWIDSYRFAFICFNLI
jgi:hypothetical protein